MPPIAVLLVEDNPINLAIYAAMLRSMGIHCDTAETMTEAQAKLAVREDYDLLMLDIQLPDGNGVALAEEYAASGGTAPALFLSSPEIISTTAGLSDHLCGFLEKPFTANSLELSIHSILRHERKNEG